MLKGWRTNNEVCKDFSFHKNHVNWWKTLYSFLLYMAPAKHISFVMKSQDVEAKFVEIVCFPMMVLDDKMH